MREHCAESDASRSGFETTSDLGEVTRWWPNSNAVLARPIPPAATTPERGAGS